MGFAYFVPPAAGLLCVSSVLWLLWRSDKALDEEHRRVVP